MTQRGKIRQNGTAARVSCCYLLSPISIFSSLKHPVMLEVFRLIRTWLFGNSTAANSGESSESIIGNEDVIIP
jgi:hypothetical protein